MPPLKQKGTHSFHQSLGALPLRGELICNPASTLGQVQSTFVSKRIRRPFGKVP